jgi:acetoin utilization deacetylase AcuC-like enzyme
MISVLGIPLEVIGIEFLRTFPEYLSEDNFQLIGPGYATDADLLLVHSEEYISFVESFYKDTASGLSLPSAFRFLSGDNIPRPGAAKLSEAARPIVGLSNSHATAD